MERLREILSVSERRKPAYTHSHTRTHPCMQSKAHMLPPLKQRAITSHLLFPNSARRSLLPSTPHFITSFHIPLTGICTHDCPMCTHARPRPHTHAVMPAHIRQIRSHSSAVPALFSGEEKNNNLMHLHLLLASLALCSTHKPHFYLANKHSRMHACKKTHTSILPHPLPSLHPAL